MSPLCKLMRSINLLNMGIRGSNPRTFNLQNQNHSVNVFELLYLTKFK